VVTASAPVLPPEVSIISPPQEMDQGESTPLGKTPKMSAHSPPSSFASNAASGATGATTPYITARLVKGAVLLRVICTSLHSYPDQCQGFVEISPLKPFDSGFPRVRH